MNYKPGDRVCIVGEVLDVMAHHNGVVGVRITFGQGVERQITVPDSIVLPAFLLETASAFSILPFDPKRLGIRELEVVRRSTDPEAWAIVSEGHNLAHDGEWEFESLPSSRTEDFYQRCRWPTAIEAIKFVQDHLAQYPTGYKDSSP